MSYPSLDFLKFVVPLLVGAVFAWMWNERQKRVAEQMERKQKRYEGLVASIQGFYAGTPSQEALKLKRAFIEELNQSWLYCPDAVIRAAYRFLDSMHTDRLSSDEVKERALSELMLALRKDLIGRRILASTSFVATDFKRFTVTPENYGSRNHPLPQ